MRHLHKHTRVLFIILILVFFNSCKTCDCPSYMKIINNTKHVTQHILSFAIIHELHTGNK
jgi:hypothetical protein